jgi:16S rRNA (guanine527-N7)-methyltransferase
VTDSRAHHSLEQQLDQGLAALGVPASVEQRRHYRNYLHLLNKWNRAYNLSAVRTIDQMLPRHLLDSLSITPFFHADNCLDVGSGGGLPGIPLAIACPDRQFTLIDSNGKKTRFLFQVVNELGLKNVTVEQGRVEEKTSPPQFDGVVSRAFSTISAMLGSCAQIMADGARIYAMKGRYPSEELEDIDAGFTVEAVQPLQIPELAGERHLIILRKV